MHAELSLSRVGVVASRQLAIINPTRIHERGLFILNHGEGEFLAIVTETATSRDWASLDYAGGLEALKIVERVKNPTLIFSLESSSMSTLV